jgi:GTPase
MEPESELGNIEYKLKLLSTTDERIESLATQMRYRCQEGEGECIYEIGVGDDGTLNGITEEEYTESITNLNKVATKNNYSVTLLSKTLTKDNKHFYEILIREKNEKKYIDIKVSIAGGVDAGKCLSPETPIIMFDGTIKYNKNIVIGDILMGENSNPMKVLKLYSGETEMFNISQSTGDNYEATVNHILTLKFDSLKIKKIRNKYKIVKHLGQGNLTNFYFNTYKESEYFLKNTKNNIETLDISVIEYLKKSTKWKKHFFGYSVSVNFCEKNINTDPYLLGSYISDKNIPINYLYNTKEIRLKLLAGIIDNNGYFSDNTYKIKLNSEILTNDICYLSRSLGFKTICKKIKNNNIEYFLTISGYDITEIPTKKVIPSFTNIKKSHETYIKIKSIGIKKYNGFELDGNGRFLLGDFTVTHNSSLVGSLISGEKDNGRGKTRSHVFNYIHELKSGRSSSISHQILGFDYEGKVVNYQGFSKPGWADIVSKSSKIISFFDLAGHEKYLKTTILGLSSSFSDICMIIVDANNGLKPMSKEHILLCISLKIPFIIVITKIDMCKDRKNIFDDTIHGINKFLKYPGIRKIPVHIKNVLDEKENIILSVKNIYNNSIVPIFYISNVTGEGIENLKTFLNILNKNPVNLKKKEDIIEFHIDHVFNVVGFGTVVGGHLFSGIIKVGDKLLIGPNRGEYETINVRSIYCKKTPLQVVSHGSYVCLGIKKIDKKNIKKGNVIISLNHTPLIVKTFTAKINILRTHSTTVKVGYEPVMNCYSLRKVVKIVEISDKQNIRNIENEDYCLRNGDEAIVKFEIKYDPQFLKNGSNFILSEGRTKIMGEIIKIN